MSLEEIGRESYKLLKEVEQSTEKVILAEFSELEKKIRAELFELLNEMKMLKRAGEKIPANLFAKQNRLNLILKAITDQIKKSATLLGIAQIEANKKAVNLAETQASKQVELQSSIFQPDTEAARNLITRAQNNTPLRQFFQRISEPVTSKIKSILLESTVRGVSADQTASQLNAALGTGRNHALSIARTELNQSFRGATLIHFENNPKVIKGYIWQSALDLDTCLICWLLHGKIFKTKDRFLPHVNCRCTLLAYFGGDAPIKTGSAKFRELTEAQQIAIMGKGRFEFYKNGRSLEDFTAIKKTEFGKVYYLKTLDELSSGKKAKPTKPAPAPKAAPPAIPAAPKPGDLPKTSQKAFDLLKKAPDHKSQLDILRVENPTNVIPKIKKGFKPAQEVKLKAAIEDFNSLVDRKFLNNVEMPFVPMKQQRAFHRAGSVHLPSYSVKPSSVIHEMSHALEQQGNGILENTLEFYEHRTKGEMEQLLKDLTGIKAYKTEKAKPDKFFHPYVGKIYKSTKLENGKFVEYIRATEIISMGVERYYTEPLAFALDDFEFFDFIFKIVRGIKWKPK